MGDGNRYDILPVIPMRYNRERYNGGTYNRTGVFHEVTVDPATAIATPAVDPLARGITLEGAAVVTPEETIAWGIEAFPDATRLYLTYCYNEPLAGDVLVGAESGATATVVSYVLLAGSFAGYDATCIVYTGGVTGVFTDDEIVRVTGKFTLLFAQGDVAFVVGDIVTGANSGCQATVNQVIVDGGAWSTGDAGGYLIVTGPSGVPEFFEVLNGTGGGHAKCTEHGGDFPPLVIGAFQSISSNTVTLPAVMYWQDIDWHITIPEPTLVSELAIQFRDASALPAVDQRLYTWYGSTYPPYSSSYVVSVQVVSGDIGSGTAAGYIFIRDYTGTMRDGDGIWNVFGTTQYGYTVGDAPVSVGHLVETPLYVHGTPEESLAWGITVTKTVYAKPIIPTVNIFTPPIATDSLLTGCTASMNMSDKMMMAQFDYVNSTTGDIPNTYFKWVELWIPDYAGVQQLVFRGFFPSGKATLAADGDHEVLTAYDPSWYLTMNTPSTDDKVFLTPATQALETVYRLWYDNNVWPLFINAGDMLVGATSGSYGIVSEEGFADGHRYVLIQNPTNLYEGHYYADNEDLTVNGVVYATADGYAVDETGLITYDSPDTYVTRLLGGTNYDRITGIWPGRITPCAWSASSDPVAIEFDCAEKETKMQIIERICKYIHYIFVVRPITIGGISYSAAYFIPEANIDLPSPSGLDLPAAVTIGATDAYLISPATHERKGDERYNQVRVRCQCAFGADVGRWFECVLPTGGYMGGDPIIEYYEVNQSLNTQAEVNARCADIYNYYSVQIESYEVTFVQRSDLRLLQKIVVEGGKLAADTYRIVDIRFDYRDSGTINDVTCTIIPDDQFKYYLNLNRVFTDSITEIQNIVRNEMDKLGIDELATVKTVDPTTGTMTVETESGETKSIRNPT